MFSFIVYSKANSTNQYQEVGKSKVVLDRDTLDESLSETQIVFISNSDKPITPLSDVRIDIQGDFADGSYGMVDMIYRVAVDDEVTQITFKGSDVMYQHSLTVDEPSKKLERYNVDNLSFTNIYEDNEKRDSTDITYGSMGFSATNYNLVNLPDSNYDPGVKPTDVYPSMTTWTRSMVTKVLRQTSIIGGSNILYTRSSDVNDNNPVGYVSPTNSSDSLAIRLASRILAGRNQSGIIMGLSCTNITEGGFGTIDRPNRVFPIGIYSHNVNDRPLPDWSDTLLQYDFSGIAVNTVSTSIRVPKVTRSSNWFEYYSYPIDYHGNIGGQVGDYKFGPNWQPGTDLPGSLIIWHFSVDQAPAIYLQKYSNGAWSDVSENLAGQTTVSVTQDGVYRYRVRSVVKYTPWAGITYVYMQSGRPHYDTGVFSSNSSVDFSADIYSSAFIKSTVGESVISGISLKSVADRVCKLSARKSMYAGSNRFVFDTTNELFAKTDAPEMIITNKNLWEALKMIGSYANSIPYLEDNTVYMLNLNDTPSVPNNFRALQRINYAAKYNSDDYTGALDVTVDNLISDFYDGAGMSTDAPHSFTSEVIEITQSSDNTLIIGTKYPIYRLNSVYPVTCIDPNGDEYPIESYYIRELALYNALNIVEQTSCLYFEQGKRGIHGLQFKVSKDFEQDASTNVSTIYNILHAVGVPDEYNNPDSIFQLSFRVTYVPIISARLKYFKSAFTKSYEAGQDSELFQNAGANVLDSKQVGRTMVNALARMGNPTYSEVYKVRYPIEGLEVGQRNSDGYIISTIDREFHTNYIVYTVYYVKDFHCLNQYLAVHNEQRYFEVSEKQSLDRYVVSSCFYTFSKSSYTAVVQNPPYILGYTDILMRTLNPGYYEGDSVSYDVSHSRVITMAQGYNLISQTYTEREVDGVTFRDFTFTFSGNVVRQVTDRPSGVTFSGTNVNGFWVMVEYSSNTPTGFAYNTGLRYSTYKSVDLILPTISIASGNTINYITDFEDNYSAGNQSIDFDNQYEQGTPTKGNSYFRYKSDKYFIPVEPGNTYASPTYVRKSSNYIQGLLKQACPYGNKYGKLSSLNIMGIRMLSTGSPTDEYKAKNSVLMRTLPAIGYYESVNNNLEFFQDDSLLTPVGLGQAASSNTPSYRFVGCEQSIYIDKDSREIIHINQQHHFISDDSSIIVGRAITEMSPFISSKRKYQYPRLVLLKRKLNPGDDIISMDDVVVLDGVGICRYRCVAPGSSALAEADASDSYIGNIISNSPFSSKIEFSIPAVAACKAWAIVMLDSIGDESSITPQWRLVVGCNEDLDTGDTPSSIYLNKTPVYPNR